MSDVFRKFAERAANAVSSPWAFVVAAVTIILWACTGPAFRYSDTWQLVINTGTTIVTFLMVFLIQNTQNREVRIVRLKLDELLRGVEGARTGFAELDKMSDQELQDALKEFERLREKYSPLVDDDLVVINQERKARRAGQRKRKSD